MEYQKTIARDKYLQELIGSRGNGMIKVITGVRRAGKSYLLFNLFYDYLVKSGVDSKHIICISLEDKNMLYLRDVDLLYDYIEERISSVGEYYVFIDEVQYAIRKKELKNELEVDLYGVLNGLLRRQNVDVYVTGSNSKLLTKDVLTAFRGRGWEIRVYPLSFAEYYNHVGGVVEKAYSDYALYGGLPKVLGFDTFAKKKQYLEQLFQEVFFKDIMERYGLPQSPLLAELVNVLCSSIGSLTNGAKLARTLVSVKGMQIPVSTIVRYLEHFEESFLFARADRYDVKGKRYFSYPSKYYCVDSGLCNARLNFRQLEETHIMENIIYVELLRRGYSVDVGVVEITEHTPAGRTKKQVEIDFVVNMGSQRLYIQSAYRAEDREKQYKETRPLLQVEDAFRKIVIVKEMYNAWYNEDGVEFIGLYDFLLHPEFINLPEGHM